MLKNHPVRAVDFVVEVDDVVVVIVVGTNDDDDDDVVDVGAANDMFCKLGVETSINANLWEAGRSAPPRRSSELELSWWTRAETCAPALMLVDMLKLAVCRCCSS